MMLGDFDRMNILICYPGTIEKSGGMQYICAQFANAMYERGHRVAVCWYGSNRIRSFYHYAEHVTFYSLRPSVIPLEAEYHDVGRDVSLSNKIIREGIRLFSRKAYRRWNDYCKRKILFPQIRLVTQTFSPNVIVSFGSDMTCFLGEIANEVPTITMMHTDPRHIFRDSYLNEIEALQRSYAIQVLSPSYVEVVKKYCPKTKVVYIPNPVQQIRPLANIAKAKEEYYIVNVARLNKDKQQHVLINAFAKLAGDFPKWNLELWGDNQTYHVYVNSLIRLIKKYRLEDRITLCGTSINIADVYRKADIFGFPSAYEGFGLALVEAMSAGLPSVGFKTCTSVNELIKDGVTGLLADEDIDSFTEKLRCLMKNKEIRIRLGEKARLEAEQFAPVHVWDTWEKLLNESNISRE